jgi:LysM repeat protein
LIIILVGGAVWLYFINRKVGGEEAVIAQKAAAPQSAESAAGAKSPKPSTENEVASAAPTSTAPNSTAPTSTAPTKEEDEFAAILRELGGTEEPSKAEAERASNTGKESEAAAVTTTPEQAPASSEELTKELAILEEQTRKAERTAEQLNKATGQLLEQEKETTTLMSKAETETREAIGSLNAGAAAEEGAEQEARAPVATTPPAEKAPVNKPEATTEAFPKTITVQSGDSLSAIAERVYGDMNKWRLIYKANQDQLKNPNELVAGMKLTIPALQE